MKGQVQLQTIALSTRIIAKVIYDTIKDKFYLSLLFFYKQKHGEVLNNMLPQHNFNDLVFITFILILTKFLQEDILKPFMSNELHPWTNCDVKYVSLKCDVSNPPWIKDCQHVVCVFVSRVSCLQKCLDLVQNMILQWSLSSDTHICMTFGIAKIIITEFRLSLNSENFIWHLV